MSYESPQISGQSQTSSQALPIKAPAKKEAEKGQLRTQTSQQNTKAVKKLGNSVNPLLRLMTNYIGVGFATKKTERAIRLTQGNIAVKDLQTVWGKRKFGDHEVGNTVNIAKKEVLRDESDFAQAVKLIGEIKRLQEEGKISEVGILDKPPEKGLLQGICWGINLDTMRRLVVNNESIDEIIKSNKKGASADAAANQAVVSLIYAKVPTYKKIDGVIAELKRLSKAPSPHEKVDCNFDAVSDAYATLRGGPRSSRTPFNRLIQQFINSEISHLGPNEEHPFLTQMQNGWQVTDPAKFKEAAIKYINHEHKEDLKNLGNGNFTWLLKTRESHLKSLDWTVSLLELHKDFTTPPNTTNQTNANGGRWNNLKQQALKLLKLKKADPQVDRLAISDPFAESIIREVVSRQEFIDRQNAITMARGVEASSVDTFGSHALHTDDESFLENLDQLPDGKYGITFSTHNGAHIISYIKEGDEIRILDPNGPQLKCREDEAKGLLLEMLSDYSVPFQSTALYREGKQNHQLVLTELKKIKDQS